MLLWHLKNGLKSIAKPHCSISGIIRQFSVKNRFIIPFLVQMLGV
jgi:hypothetical protein